MSGKIDRSEEKKADEEVQGGGCAVEQFHGELKQIARRELNRHRRSGTFDTVALVNEAYLRVHEADRRWQSRGHFLASMTTIMRNVLVDHAREKSAQRRGGNWLRVTTGALDAVTDGGEPVDILQLDQAMRQLGALSERLERVVELKVFGGMTIQEIAAVLEISPATVSRELRLASAWLRRAMAETP
ncbi:ECF-type sigma factor [Wenzhouxiangella sediminis]|uniref:Sigma-70 family RNA polymerase sigma factor n=1 Tax=Wenzhouxiangella sediminis TaxID=1792836 RepID=A0A3E1KCF3_9GAMM|nr:ECF-type sigma factor [Wenzhouxiangella sediminis]RFF32585.1 sigma-70 family RNA polymerase sigma factor [Wenzhouxiangella sediminis]